MISLQIKWLKYEGVVKYMNMKHDEAERCGVQNGSKSL